MTPTEHHAWSRVLLRPPITKPHLPDTQLLTQKQLHFPTALRAAHLLVTSVTGATAPSATHPTPVKNRPVSPVRTSRVSWCGWWCKSCSIFMVLLPIYTLLCSSPVPRSRLVPVVHARTADVTCPAPVHASLGCTPRLGLSLPCGQRLCALSHGDLSLAPVRASLVGASPPTG